MTETPKFNNQEEFLAWAFGQTSEAIKNLTQRIENLESAIQKIPPPGPDMIKYKIPGDDGYSNLKELLDNLYERINKIETESAYSEFLETHGSVHPGDRSEFSHPD